MGHLKFGIRIVFVVLGYLLGPVLIRAEENIPYDPKPCIDCHRQTVLPGEYYYDGCNVCFCYERGLSVCTEKWCKWNKCYQVENEEEEKEEREKKEEETTYKAHQRPRGHWWK